MEDSSTHELKDYKFFCFGGVAHCFKVDFDRFIEHHANYYDLQGNILEFGEADLPPVYNKNIDMPININSMKLLAEELSKNIPFLRVDFYNVDENIHFGELTFYPASGFGKFTSSEADEQMGKWLRLPDDIGGGIC